MEFLKKLQQFDKEGISNNIMSKAKNILESKEFDLNEIKNAS